MRRTQFLAVGALVVVGAGTGVLAYRWQQRGPGRASVGAAVDRYRQAGSAPSTPGAWVPRAGVYVYGGSGTEHLSFLGTHQEQGPSGPATLTVRAGGCWQLRVDFNSFHHQVWDRCSRGHTITESGGTTDQRFDFMAFGSSEHSTVVCDPPYVVADLDAAPGATAPVRCTGRSQTTNSSFVQAGTATFLGRGSLDVAGAAVPAVHSRLALRLSGGETGTVDIDLWFAVADALPLAESHAITVDSPAPAPIGHVTYTERGSWRLTSLAPST